MANLARRHARSFTCGCQITRASARHKSRTLPSATTLPTLLSMSRIHFSPEKTELKHAIVASFDMRGFSTFCRSPNAHAYLNRYIAGVFDFFDNAFQDWLRDFFKDTTNLLQIPRPTFSKYTGDGALLMWVKDSGEELTNAFCTSAVVVLRQFQQQLPAQILQWERDWKTHSLPNSARFGIAVGPVHPLEAASAATLF